MAAIHRMAHRLVYQTLFALSIPKVRDLGHFFGAGAGVPLPRAARAPRHGAARLTGAKNADKMNMCAGTAARAEMI